MSYYQQEPQLPQMPEHLQKSRYVGYVIPIVKGGKFVGWHLSADGARQMLMDFCQDNNCKPFVRPPSVIRAENMFGIVSTIDFIVLGDKEPFMSSSDVATFVPTMVAYEWNQATQKKDLRVSVPDPDAFEKKATKAWRRAILKAIGDPCGELCTAEDMVEAGFEAAPKPQPQQVYQQPQQQFPAVPQVVQQRTPAQNYTDNYPTQNNPNLASQKQVDFYMQMVNNLAKRLGTPADKMIAMTLKEVRKNSITDLTKSEISTYIERIQKKLDETKHLSKSKGKNAQTGLAMSDPMDNVPPEFDQQDSENSFEEEANYLLEVFPGSEVVRG